MTASFGLRSDASSQVYSEDVVTYADPRDEAEGASTHYGTCVGLVSRVAGDDPDDDEEEWEDDDEVPVPDDHAEVCWLHSDGTRVETTPNAKLRVLDRAFIHGDVVARAANALGIQGVVVGVNVDADLQFADGSRHLGVSTRRLTQVRHFRPGHYVVHPGLGGWVGRIDEVADDVVVRFDDGSECVFHDPDVERLIPAEDSSLFPDEEQCAYFPGLVVHASTSALRSATWTRGRTNRLNRGSNRTHVGVVAEVRPGTLLVDWIAQRDVYDAGTGERVGEQPPAERVGVEGLWALTFFAHTCWQLGDRCVVDTLETRRKTDLYVEDLASYLPTGDGEVYECGESPEEVAARHARLDESVIASATASIFHGPAASVNRGTFAAFAAGKFDDVNGSEGQRGGSRGNWGVGSRRRNARRQGGGRATGTTGSGGDSPGGDPPGGDSSTTNVNPDTPVPPPIRPCAVITATRTFVDVHWQDGSVTRRVPSANLVPITHLGEHDFQPEQFVTRRAEDDATDDAPDDAPDDATDDAHESNASTAAWDPWDRVGRRLGGALGPESSAAATESLAAATESLANAEYLEQAMARYDRYLDGNDDDDDSDDNALTYNAFGRDLIRGTIERLRRDADERAPRGDRVDIARALGATAMDVAGDAGVSFDEAAYRRRFMYAQAALYNLDGGVVPGVDRGVGPHNPNPPPAKDKPAGVIVSVDPSERIAKVRWLEPEVVGGNYVLDPDVPRIEDVSVYDLREHGEFSFRLGDIVVQLPDATEERQEMSARHLRERDELVARHLREVQEEEARAAEEGAAEEAEDMRPRWTQISAEDMHRARGPDKETLAQEAQKEAAQEEAAEEESEYETGGESDADDEPIQSSLGSESDEPESEPDSDDGEWRTVQDSPQTGFSVERNTATGRVRVVPSVDPKTLTWVGEVVGVSDGSVRVAWGDGSIAFANPATLYIVNGDEADGENFDEEDLGSLMDGDEFGDEYAAGSDGGSWETDGDDDDEEEGDEERDGRGHSGVGQVSDMGSVRHGPSPAMMHPAALAWGNLRAEEQERSWLTMHRRMAGAEPEPDAEPDADAPDPEPQPQPEPEAAPPPSTSATETGEAPAMSKEDAARAAEAIAAAFRNMGRGAAGAGTRVIDASQLAARTGTRVIDASQLAAALNVPIPDVPIPVPAAAPVPVPASAAAPEAADEERYSRFESISGDSGSDHFYAQEPSSGLADRKWTKTIAKEWSVLKDSVPDTIWCRAYEDRMDLTRAVLVGPAGTPYHDNLFVFDFHFTPSYPAEPPKAHYHSFGQRVNPNLYESGKVCLSLLHTWQGKGSEVWSPETSNMLQVLVSIQGLVLVEKAYYNEAGYEKQVGSEEGERNNAQYAEQAFLASLKTMMGLLRKPPRHCEALIRDHFAKRRDAILAACDAYQGGCPVGVYVHRGADPGGAEGGAEGRGASTGEIEPVAAARCSNTAPPSAGFKLALGGLTPKLRKALDDNAAAGPFGPPPFG